MNWILLLAMTIAGYMLPADHAASRTAKFRKPQADVFELISGPQTWRPHAERDKESKPPHRYVTRIGNASLPYGGTWTWEIDPTAEGCVVNVTENGKPGD